MKIFAFLLLLFGLASASRDEVLDDAADEWVLEGMQKTPSLRGVEDAHQAEDAIQTELGKALRDGIEKILERVKDAVNEGKEVRQELLDKLKELRRKLGDLKADLGERGQALLREIKEQARDSLKKLLKKYGLDKRSEEGLDYKDMLRKLKEHLKKNVDPELLKEKIEKIFDQGTEMLRMLLRTLKEKGKRKLEILVDLLLGDDEDRESRSIKEYWEKVKDYFKDLKIDLQEKYMKFGEWVKNVVDKGWENSKDKMENIKAIAKEFARHAKNVSKEVGAEASEFFRQYKDELGNVWEELKETFKEIQNRKD